MLKKYVLRQEPTLPANVHRYFVASSRSAREADFTEEEEKHLFRHIPRSEDGRSSR